jgi:hypothetical protein
MRRLCGLVVRVPGIRHADHVAPSIRRKLELTSLTSGGRSVGIVRLRTEAKEFYETTYLYSESLG